MSESEDIKPLFKFESDSKALKRDQKMVLKENNKGYHVHKGLKMLNSTFDAEEIFEDWNWNLLEEERLEDIFSEWLWNLEPQVDLRQKFYNDPSMEDAWNDFYFWRFNTSHNIDIDLTTKNAILAQQLMEEGREQKLSQWLGTDCKYWEGSYQNEAILHSLLQDEIEENSSSQGLQSQQYLSFFWDESATNRATMELLMRHEEKEKEIVFANTSQPSKKSQENEQQSVQYFPWEDPDTVAGLLEGEYLSRRPSNDSVFLWDDPAAIGMLLTDEEEEETLLARDDKTDMTEELLPEWTTTGKTETGRREEKSKKREQHTTWEQW